MFGGKKFDTVKRLKWKLWKLESEGAGFDDLAMKYGIKGKTTVSRWTRQYGNGTRGKVMRVERPGEINEVKRLTARVRRLERRPGRCEYRRRVGTGLYADRVRRAGIADVAGLKKPLARRA